MPDVVVIGGGPAGAVVSALLASWGHDVTLVAQTIESGRGLVNSLPPSTRKILERVGILDIVQRIGFPTTGNTVWWGDEERVESFGEASAPGYQVFRPALDRLLLEWAGAAGARVIDDATVTRAEVGDGGAQVSYRSKNGDALITAQLALDCSGRSGVVARQGRRRPADVQMQALLGAWSHPGGWPSGDERHTSVETYDDGWAWTVPISSAVRHTGVMIHGARSRLVRGRSLTETYTRELAKSRRLAAQVEGAVCGEVWACDASIYSASSFAGAGYLLIGDAGLTIDPLSSFGLKKALTSAWLGAVAANTRLRHPLRDPHVLTFYSQWETEVYDTHLRRSRDFAVEASRRHPSAFWEAQARMPVGSAAAIDERTLLREPAVASALAELKRQPRLQLRRHVEAGLRDTPIVRDREIEIVSAIPVDARRSLRFFSNVDLIALADMAAEHTELSELYDSYRRRYAVVGITDLLAALSFLIGRGLLVMSSH